MKKTPKNKATKKPIKENVKKAHVIKQKPKTKQKQAKKDKEIMRLKENASQLLAQAKAKHLDTNFIFCSTFNRYITQIELLSTLKQAFNEDAPMIVKEYVKGRENKTANPLITKINQTIDSSNKTASLLFKLLINYEDLEEKARTLTDNELIELNKEINNLTDKQIVRKYGVSKEEAQRQISNNSFLLL